MVQFEHHKFGALLATWASWGCWQWLLGGTLWWI